MDREHIRIKHTPTAILLLLILSVCSSCYRSTQSGDPRRPYFSEEYQVKDLESGKVSAFGLNIGPAREMGDWAVGWVSGVTDGEGFRYLLYADPDSWDAYLYYPVGQTEIQRLTNDDVAVAYADGVLRVYVMTVPADSTGEIVEDSEKGQKGPKDSEKGPEDSGKGPEDGKKTARWLLHLAAPPAGAWPSEVELYWDGIEVPCDPVDIEG